MTTVRETLGPRYRVDLFVAGVNGARVREAEVDGEPVEPVTVETDEDGNWEVDLVPNEDITPGGTVWARVAARGGADSTQYGIVEGAGPLNWEDLLTDPPGSLGVPGLEAEENARIAADQVLAAAIQAEATAREAGDGASLDAVAAEAASRGNAITAEATTRGNADLALSQRLDPIEALGPLATAASVTAEAAARVGADEDLAFAIGVETAARAADDDTLTAAVTAETDARTAADAALDGRVAALEAEGIAPSWLIGGL